MRKKFLATVSMLALALYATPVQAADLPYAPSNSWSITTTGGGQSTTYTVPYTGDFEVTLSGAQGSANKSNSGEYGTVISGTIRLNKGDRVSWYLPPKASNYTSGDTQHVPAGGDAIFYVNGTERMRAAGGRGLIDSWQTGDLLPSTIKHVKAYGGNSITYDIHYHVGAPPRNVGTDGCWTGWHAFIKGSCREGACRCYEEPTGWVSDGTDENGNPKGHYTGTKHVCKGHEHECSDAQRAISNSWKTTCGYQQGEIYTHVGEQPNTRSSSTTLPGTSVGSATNAGAANCTLSLAEHNGLYYYNGSVSYPSYRGVDCYLVIRDGRVVYFNR